MRELGLDTVVARKDVPIDLRTGRLFPKDDAKLTHYRNHIHPDARQPALVSGDGHYTLFESLAINYYLAKQVPSSPLCPKTAEEEARVMQWAIWIHANAEAACVNLMFAGMMRNKEKQAKRKAELFKQLERPFGALNTWLSSHRYLLGDERWSIADLNVATVIEWGIAAGMDLGKYPALARWWKESTSRPAYSAKTKSKL